MELNWNWVMQACSSIATYFALIGAFSAGYSLLEFALFTAILLSLWLSLFAIASTKKPQSHSAKYPDSIFPSLSESISELHSLQNEISKLQSQFAAQTKAQRNASGDSAI